MGELSNIKIGLNGKTKPCSSLGFVVGSEIEVSWELTNLDSKRFPGGRLRITMVPPNQQYVWFEFIVGTLNPGDKVIIDNDTHGNPLITNVLAQGFTLFFAQLQNADIYSPPNRLINKDTSFLSMLGKSKEEVYALAGLILASIGLIGTTIIGIIQLLHGFLII